MGSGGSGNGSIGNTSGSHDDGYRHVNGFTTKLHEGAQGKHIPSHNNYDKDVGRSIFKGSLEKAQNLISDFAGSGSWLGSNKEVVDFGETIGTWINNKTGERLPTSRGTIHYGKKGAHIVPAYPDGGE